MIELGPKKLTVKLRLCTRVAILSHSQSIPFVTCDLMPSMCWKLCSSGLYRKILHEGLISLPATGYLKPLSQTLNIDSGLAESMIFHLKKKISSLLGEKEKNDRSPRAKIGLYRVREDLQACDRPPVAVSLDSGAFIFGCKVKTAGAFSPSCITVILLFFPQTPLAGESTRDGTVSKKLE